MSAQNTANNNWTDNEGNPSGGQSTGIGFTIAWQRGPIVNGVRNGAFLIEVLESCVNQLEYFQSSKFASDENLEALDHLNLALVSLNSRLNRRKSEGTLGTHKV